MFTGGSSREKYRAGRWIMSGSLVHLLTGRPGVGKTTIIRQLASMLGPAAAGFYTQEVRHSGSRIGFELVTLTGERAWLAARPGAASFRHGVPFGSYRVNLETIEALGVPTLLEALHGGMLIVVDEIGPMEMLSRYFQNAIQSILDSCAPVVGTIVARSHPFADRVKAHPRVVLHEVTLANRDVLATQLLAAIGSGQTGQP